MDDGVSQRLNACRYKERRRVGEGAREGSSRDVSDKPVSHLDTRGLAKGWKLLESWQGRDVGSDSAKQSFKLFFPTKPLNKVLTTGFF